VVVEGDEAVVSAILTQPTRTALSAALLGDVTVEGGAVVQSYPDSYLHVIHDRAGIVRDVARLKALAARLVEPEDVAQCLARRAGTEPVPGARAHVLSILARRFPERGLPILRAALQDGDERVRLGAAKALGDEGAAELMRLAGNGQARDETRAEAIELLGDRVSIADIVPLLTGALQRDREAVVKSAIGALERVAQREGQAPTPAAERALIDALAHGSNAVRMAAAGALGQLGSVGAVAALMAAIQERALDFGFDRAARGAIAEIQSRLSGAERGQVSLASDGGQLSISERETSGHISVAAEDED